MFRIVSVIWEALRSRSRVDPPDPSDPCNAPACVEAQDTLAAERKAYAKLCWYAQVLNVVTKTLKAVVSVPLWVIAALVAIAIFFGGPIAVVIMGGLAAYALAWFLLTFVIPQVTLHVGQALAMSQAAVMEAIAGVMADCPQECHGDVTAPECQLD